MKICVDIDDTISKTNERLMEEAIRYDRECCRGRGFKDKDAYSLMDLFYWNVVELDKFFSIIHTAKFYASLGMVEDANTYVNQLKKDGHEIYFITKRKKTFNISSKTKKWLKDFGFNYNKLVLGVNKKGEKCKELGIDLIIDNDIKNIKDAESYGIKGIVKGTKFNETENHLRIEEWADIYKYISKGD